MKRKLNETEADVLRMYLFGGMETVYEWVAGGMIMPVERMVELQEIAMPELIKQWVISSEDVPYEEALKVMEQYLLAEGLLQEIS